MTKVTLYLPFILTSPKQSVSGGTSIGVTRVLTADLVPKTDAVKVWLPPGKHLVAIPTVVGKPFDLFMVSITCVVTKQHMSATVTAEARVFEVVTTLPILPSLRSTLAVYL